MADIFPFVQPTLYSEEAEELPIYRDVAWDFSQNRPICVRGEPKIVEGLPAVMSWAWRALHTERFLNEIYSWDYGNEVMSLVGGEWAPETKVAEASRYIEECLTQSPYITGIEKPVATFSGSTVTLSCKVLTVYGSDQLEVTL